MTVLNRTPTSAGPSQIGGRSHESPQMLEFLEDRLYLTALARPPTPKFMPHLYFFTVDDALVYNPFFHDFGPLNISHLFRFSLLLHEILSDPAIHQDRPVVFYSRPDSRSRANAACLLACYMVLVQQWPPHLVLAPLAEADPPFMPFRDASYAPADYTLSIQDCVYGVWRAKEAGILEIRDLDVNEYERYERVENGDFNWVSPHFLAFASPNCPECRDCPSGSGGRHGRCGRVADQDLPAPFTSVMSYFGKNRVRLVVRLNSPLYDPEHFRVRGIEHHDLFFEDGTVPSLEIVREFIDRAVQVFQRDSESVIAVHCKAGLGRTGCLIGAYLIYRYAFTANEVIAYMRILRPGMVVGPQQHWLHINQHQFREWFYQDQYSISSNQQARLAVAALSSPPEIAKMDDDEDDISHTVAMATPTRPPLSELRQARSAQVENTPLNMPTPGQPRKSSVNRHTSDRYHQQQERRRHSSVKEETEDDGDDTDAENELAPPQPEDLTASGVPGAAAENVRSLNEKLWQGIQQEERVRSGGCMAGRRSVSVHSDRGGGASLLQDAMLADDAMTAHILGDDLDDGPPALTMITAHTSSSPVRTRSSTSRVSSLSGAVEAKLQQGSPARMPSSMSNGGSVRSLASQSYANQLGGGSTRSPSGTLGGRVAKSRQSSARQPSVRSSSRKFV